MTDDEAGSHPDRFVVVFSLQKAQYEMMRQLADELRITETVLAEHAITSLWVSVQLQRGAARLK